MNNQLTTTEQKFNHVWSRICKVTGWKAQSELALFLNIRPSSVSGAKQRDKFPIDWAFRIAQSYSCTTDWIMTGQKPSPLHPIQSPIPQVYEHDVSYDVSRKWSLVPPTFPCRPRCERKPLPHLFAVPTPNPAGEKLGFVSCHMPDDTMEPTICRGELLLIELHKKKIDCSGIYALKAETSIIVRRIELLENSDLFLICDNPLYENRSTPIDTLKPSILGRITCHMRRI